MGKQPEAKVSTAIMKAWRKMDAWCYKVWGNEYTPAGVPDICGIYKGLSVWCETKMPGNKPSPIQKYRINRIRAAGAFVVVAYSVAEAVQMLEHIDTSDCTHTPETCVYRAKFELDE